MALEAVQATAPDTRMGEGMSDLRPPDDCPSCVTGMHSVTVQPHSVQPWPGGIRADYRCPSCGHRWFTGWNLDALDLPKAGAT
jgi:hypothetical protein